MTGLPTIKRFPFAVLAAAMMLSCSSINYVGKSYEPTTDVDIYMTLDDIKGEYEVMGSVVASAESWVVSSEKLQEEIIKKAREKGADAVVILGYDEYVTGGGSTWEETTKKEDTVDGVKVTTSGSESENTTSKKEIRATFIKYK